CLHPLAIARKESEYSLSFLSVHLVQPDELEERARLLRQGGVEVRDAGELFLGGREVLLCHEALHDPMRLQGTGQPPRKAKCPKLAERCFLAVHSSGTIRHMPSLRLTTRRDVLRMLGAGLAAACAGAPRRSGAYRLRLPPVRVAAAREIRTVVGLRPFRPS